MLTRIKAYGAKSLIIDGKKEKIAGIDADPNDDCKVKLDKEGMPTVSIYDQPATRMDMVDFMEERYDNHIKGKSLTPKRYFSGVNFDESGKIIR